MSPVLHLLHTRFLLGAVYCFICAQSPLKQYTAEPTRTPGSATRTDTAEDRGSND